MSEAKVSITFRIHQGDSPARTEVLAQDIVKIGKLPSSHLRIDDDDVSRMHAVIEVGADREVHVIDLGSASGTIVNGKKVNKARLVTGDELTLGRTRVVVEIARAMPALLPIATPLPNPFAASIALAHEPLAPFAIEYGIAASRPALEPSELETTALAAEVMILWGDRSVLHVAHLSPPRTFTIGDPDARGTPIDFVIDGLALGGDRMPLVVESAGRIAVVVPKDASGEIRIDGASVAIEALRAQGKLVACAELASAEQFALPHGATATIRHRGFTFVTKATSAGSAAFRGSDASLRTQLWTAISLGVHAAFLLMFYFLPPSASALSLDLLSPDDRLVQYLMTPPATVDDPPPDWLDTTVPTESEGGTGQAAADESGAMGDEESPHTTNRFAIQGPEDNVTPEMARERAQDRAREVASAMGTMLTQLGSWDSPTSPYGADSAIGADPMSALGAPMGDQSGANFGFGGLGPRGTGRGGGGLGLGTIGQGRLGTIGHGNGIGDGNGYGEGAGDFHGGPPHPPLPRIRPGEADVHGSLSREVIRRVIQRHVNEVRFCYEQELSQRPDLAGRVTVSFIISQTGAVSSSALTASTLGNARVESCVVTAVHRWTFPAPEGGGVVGVNYPFVLDSTGGPGES